MDDAADENEMKAIIAGIRKSGSKRFLEKTHGKNTNALFSIWDGRISLMHAKLFILMLTRFPFILCSRMTGWQGGRPATPAALRAQPAASAASQPLRPTAQPAAPAADTADKTDSPR